MFLKITRSGPRQYLQLVEAFRDDAGKAKHRTLVTLGRLDQLTDSLDSVISRLSETHNRVFAALNLKKPTQPQQLSLL